MLTVHKDVRRLAPEKGVNKSFKNVSCQGPIEKIFSRMRAPNVDIYKRTFPAKLI